MLLAGLYLPPHLLKIRERDVYILWLLREEGKYILPWSNEKNRQKLGKVLQS